LKADTEAVEALMTRWHDLTERFAIRSDGNQTRDLFAEIMTAYTGRARHYHTLDHLASMFTEVDPFLASCAHGDALCFAIWYHDVVYSTLRDDSESQSAELARKRLRVVGLDGDQVSLVDDWITRTKNHLTRRADEAFELRLLLDADLAILGSSATDYAEYSAQIRLEYRMVPGMLYRRGRKTMLQTFLEADSIYRLEPFRDRYEDQARRNIQAELEQL